MVVHCRGTGGRVARWSTKKYLEVTVLFGREDSVRQGWVTF